MHAVPFKGHMQMRTRTHTKRFFRGKNVTNKPFLLDTTRHDATDAALRRAFHHDGRFPPSPEARGDPRARAVAQKTLHLPVVDFGVERWQLDACAVEQWDGAADDGATGEGRQYRGRLGDRRVPEDEGEQVFQGAERRRQGRYGVAAHVQMLATCGVWVREAKIVF